VPQADRCSAVSSVYRLTRTSDAGNTVNPSVFAVFNHQLVLAWRLYRKFCRLLAPENAPDVAGPQCYEHIGMICAKLTISAELKKAGYLNERGRPFRTAPS